jgi:serine/threonine protein kinase
LFNEELKVSRNFQVSFSKDVVKVSDGCSADYIQTIDYPFHTFPFPPKGLFFLHTSTLKYHGFLCLQNCLVDSNWIVKLTNFVTEEIVGDKLRHNELKYISESELIRQRKDREKTKERTMKRSGEEADDGDEAGGGGKKGKGGGGGGGRKGGGGGGDKADRRRGEKQGNNSTDESRLSGAEEEQQEEALVNIRMREKNTTKSDEANRKWKGHFNYCKSPFAEYIQQSPEIIREFISSKHLPQGSPASDMYSLGMVLYQILFKLEPFYERNLQPKSLCGIGRESLLLFIHN